MNLHDELRAVSAQIARLQVRFAQLKSSAAMSGDDCVTRISVRAHRVKSHQRRTHSYVRLKK